ncbi:hypothetical protein CDD80_939 [Ophiocordyceps camponoti-rufipedis]|uniref:Uncharacterized protein n=1 Tax=Ophiocordyceps camponoti-rufipedis TaxID=2004952 RepID=A0A2C5YFR7_9HYPO|nr:hypothetical protein CDD80_939 [Ophiocordyceps camponoti-rufipedis]
MADASDSQVLGAGRTHYTHPSPSSGRAELSGRAADLGIGSAAHAPHLSLPLPSSSTPFSTIARPLLSPLFSSRPLVPSYSPTHPLTLLHAARPTHTRLLRLSFSGQASSVPLQPPKKAIDGLAVHAAAPFFGPRPLSPPHRLLDVSVCEGMQAAVYFAHQYSSCFHPPAPDALAPSTPPLNGRPPSPGRCSVGATEGDGIGDEWKIWGQKGEEKGEEKRGMNGKEEHARARPSTTHNKAPLKTPGHDLASSENNSNSPSLHKAPSTPSETPSPDNKASSTHVVMRTRAAHGPVSPTSHAPP